MHTNNGTPNQSCSCAMQALQYGANWCMHTSIYTLAVLCKKEQFVSSTLNPRIPTELWYSLPLWTCSVPPCIYSPCTIQIEMAQCCNFCVCPMHMCMVCCAVLCHAALCPAMLCYAILCTRMRVVCAHTHVHKTCVQVCTLAVLCEN